MALLIIPVFAWRRYVQNKGRFPVSEGTAEDPFEKKLVVPRAGWLPYAALAACALLVWATHNWPRLPG